MTRCWPEDSGSSRRQRRQKTRKHEHEIICKPDNQALIVAKISIEYCIANKLLFSPLHYWPFEYFAWMSPADMMSTSRAMHKAGAAIMQNQQPGLVTRILMASRHVGLVNPVNFQK